MRRIELVGDIGSGKTFLSKLFKYPVFNADLQVIELYKKDKFLFRKIKRKFPKNVTRFPIKKDEILKIIFKKKKNLIILGKLIHPFVRKKMNNFSKINKKQKFVILDTDFSVPGGELTETQKLRRKVVVEKYSEKIDSMYTAASSVEL